MVQEVRLMMFSLNMVDYSMSFLLLSTWNCRGDHSEPFLLFKFFCGTPPSCLKVFGGGGLQDFSVSPSLFGANQGFELDWTGLGFGLVEGLRTKGLTIFIFYISICLYMRLVASGASPLLSYYAQTKSLVQNCDWQKQILNVTETKISESYYEVQVLKNM